MELPGGNYKVLFRLKVSDNTKSKPIAKLYVKATRAGSEQELAHFTLKPTHFSRANAWEVFELPVEIRDDDANVKIGVEFYGGVADLWCDWIRAVPAGTAIVGNLRVLGSGGLDCAALKIRGTEVITGDRVLKNLDRLDLMGAYLARPMLQPLGNLVFAETFDRYTDPAELDENWDVVYRTSVITFEEGFSGLGKSIRSADLEGGLGLELIKHIPKTKVLVVRFMYKDNSGGYNIYMGMPNLENSESNVRVLKTYQHSGKILYETSSGGYVTLAEIPQGEWVEVMWYVDVNAGTFKLWVNGEYCGEHELTTGGYEIDTIRFRSNYASNTEDYQLDNIQVWIPASVKHELAGSLNAEALRIKGAEVIAANRQLKNVSADAGIITSGTFALDRIPTIPASKADPNFGTTGDRMLASSDTMFETTSTSYQLAWTVQVEALEDVKNVIEYVRAQIRVGPSSGGGSPPPPDSEAACER